MKQIFDTVSLKASEITTKSYSTSFSKGISMLGKEIQAPIYAIYGFVRFADEIVDTFHDYDKEYLFADFKRQTYDALQHGISLNPILNSFQWAVKKYNIDQELIDCFLDSMEMDLQKHEYSQEKYEKYILGSAEVVGLMCLKVFLGGDQKEYERLKPFAMKLGAAFQKINFLRDLKADYHDLGRIYFPNVDMSQFNKLTKADIEKDIEIDFQTGLAGIKQLPKNARFGVYMAYKYYYKLFDRIKNTNAEVILNERVRIPDAKKFRLFVSSYLRHNLNLL